MYLKDNFSDNEAQNIPGMIEPIEQKALYELTKSLDLSRDCQIVEFGTFFGRSTNCIAQGLCDNQTAKNTKIYAYDSFTCRKDGSFEPHVISNAIQGNVQELIERRSNTISFERVFRHYLKHFIDSDLVVPIATELQNSKPINRSEIALMHIDSPKFYSELRFIISEFFPLLRSESIIIFQDFFYHWSGSLIAAIEYLRSEKLLTYQFSAASSLIVNVNGPITKDILIGLDSAMTEVSRIYELIEDAADACGPLKIDRSSIFIPRLKLAAFQVLWSANKTAQATDMLVRHARSERAISEPFLVDFLEMMRTGFSIREEYCRDHSACDN
jgi:hypothetical protein